MEEHFPMQFEGGRVFLVTKMKKEEFTSKHRETLKSLQLKEKKIIFPGGEFEGVLLGAGEEKAVYAIKDENDCVFALELIDERHYLNGRLIDGEYFCNMGLGQLSGKKWNQDSIIGLEFTGLVKAREFIRGFEWGRFCYRDTERTTGIDTFLTGYLKDRFRRQFQEFEQNYKDVHERNVMFEILSHEEKGVSVWIRRMDGKREKVSIRLRGIDLR